MKGLILLADVLRWLAFACAGGVVITSATCSPIIGHILVGMLFACVLGHAVIVSMILRARERGRK